jgi:hypothetical protein
MKRVPVARTDEKPWLVVLLFLVFSPGLVNAIGNFLVTMLGGR